jgi:hypothetical protein
MRRLVLTACAALMLAVVPAASPGVHQSGLATGVPGALHAFLLRADEPIAHEYPRTPSFAWSPAPEHGGHYEFELATSPSFQDGSLVFHDPTLAIPAETIPRQLPWMEGNPYALWAHVRWVSDDGRQATRWSNPFGFNMKWRDQDVPQQIPAPDGLIRWQPIEGATGYEVLYTDIHPSHSFQTTTNVADEREFFTFHSDFGYSMQIHWRVRAIRDVSRLAGPTNGLPRVAYGPWSAVFTSTNAPQSAGTTTLTDTVSDAWGKSKQGHQFHLTPGFGWTPSTPIVTDGIDAGSPLYRVYIFTDKHCVNRVFTGSVVGSPAYAPRTVGGPIKLPATSKALTKVKGGFYPGPGSEGVAIDPAGEAVRSNEGAGASVSDTSSSSTSGSGTAGGAGTGSTSTAGSASSSSAGTGSTDASGSGAGLAQVDLWDSGWPSGRYYWTVVPVTIFAESTDDGGGSDTALAYQDAAVPQDVCESGTMMNFGKVTRPVVTSAGKPFVSGVAPKGRMVAAVRTQGSVYQLPIVAWQPAVGATTYEIELSRSLYPWRSAKKLTTPATAITLPLTKFAAGTWFYRVRGVNGALPAGAQAMTWSAPIAIRITGDQFKIVSSSAKG